MGISQIIYVKSIVHFYCFQIHLDVLEKQDNRYVILTFILVGSIAVIVLSVTITYMLKYHRISKEKLAQLSASGDVIEASKDYQVLNIKYLWTCFI